MNNSKLQTPNSKLSCAVVVASFRPGQLIDQCLQSLLAQQGVANVQIVVVDSSTDGTAERLRRDFSTIEVIGLEQQTHQSIARNIGISHTQAPFVAITDQDCIVPPDWLARLLARHQESEYAGVGGAIGNGTPDSAVGTASYLIEFNEFLPAGTPHLVPMVPHCNVCFRREVFSTVGPFIAVPPGAEDQVYNFLLCQKGQRLLFDPAIVVRHLNRTDFSAFLRHQHLLGFGSAIARRTVAIPGQIFVRYPVLVYALPFVRLFRTLTRLFTNNRPVFLLYIRLLPLFVPGYVSWTRGFRVGLRHELPSTSVLDSRKGCQPYLMQKDKRVPVMRSGSISIVIPVLNEAEALPELVERTDAVLQQFAPSYEILVIDDGSTDDTPFVLRQLSTRYPHLSVIRFRRNYGKAAALSEAFTRAQGDFLITMDGDLQDPPEEIPRFVQQLHGRYDVVCGWKQHRQDSWDRVIGSRLFNSVTCWMTGLQLHDINCGLKGYRRRVVQELRLYGEMHRFIPVIARQRGFLIGELPVQHFPRRFGRSRYGWSRPISGLFDLITLVMLGRYTHKPLHFFGLLGLACSGVGLLILLILGIGWLHGQWIGNRPLFLFSIFLMLSGTQLIFFGLLAELLIYLSGQRQDCGIDEMIEGILTEGENGDVHRPNGNDSTGRSAQPSPPL